MLTVLLALVLCADFIAEPPAARGLPLARTVADALVLALFSNSRSAVATSRCYDLGLAEPRRNDRKSRVQQTVAPIAGTLLHRGGGIVAFSALAWVGHAVYAPGRITYRRLQGALLSIAAIFASAYGVIWELVPGAFGSTQATMRRPRR